MGLGFILLPLYTHYLTPSDYGILSVITAITAFLSRLFLMSLHSAASRFHFNSDKTDYRAKVWGTTLLMVVANSIIWGILLIVFHKYLIDPLAKEIPFYPLLLLAILGTMLSPLYLFFQQWLRNTQDGIKYSMLSISYVIFNTILNLFCLVVFKMGVLGMVLSTFLISLFFFIYSLWAFTPKLNVKFDRGIGVGTIKYAIPLIPHNLIGYWSGAIDKLLLNNMSGAASVGLYGIASQFGGVINVFEDGVRKAFSPWCYQILSVGDNKGYGKLYTFADISVLLYCIIAMIISLFSPEVISIMTSEPFKLAWQPITFICFGYVFRGLYFFFCQPLFFSHTKYVMLVSLSSLIVNIACNILLIPILAEIGAGLSLFISMVALSISALIISRNKEPQIHFHYIRMILMTFIFMLLSMAVFFFEKIDILIYRLGGKFFLVGVLILLSIYCYRQDFDVLKTVLAAKRHDLSISLLNKDSK